MTYISKEQLHYPALDGLRGVAILLVIASHLNLTAHDSLMLLPGGILGVDIFFVLSGFLITNILNSYGAYINGKILLYDFYVRRAARLFPALILLLFSHAIILIFLSSDPVSKQLLIDGITAALFYCVNWVMIIRCDYLGSLSHLWSLSVEEQFYLFYPATFYVCHKLKSRKLLYIILIALAIISSYLRIGLLYSQSGDNYCDMLVMHHGTHARFFGLSIGCILSNLIFDGYFKNFSKSTHLLFFPWIIFSAYLIADRKLQYAYGGFEVVSITTALLILGIIRNKAKLFSVALSNRLLCYFGKLSYGIYLWHYPIILYANTWIKDWPRLLVSALSLALIFAFSALSFHFIEKPIINTYKRKLKRSHVFTQ